MQTIGNCIRWLFVRYQHDFLTPCPFLTLSYQCGCLTTSFCQKAQEKLTYPRQSYTVRNVRFVETQLRYKLWKLAELPGISANTTVHVLNDRCLVFAALQRCLE